jgi:hypothetical protein
MLHVDFVATYIRIEFMRPFRIRRWLPPFALAMLHAILELALVGIAVGPFIQTFPLWLSISIFTHILIPIIKEISSIPMPQALFPLSFISISIYPHMHSIPFRSAIHP